MSDIIDGGELLGEIIMHEPLISKYRCLKCGFVLPGIGLKFFGKDIEAAGLNRDYCMACWIRALDAMGIGQVEKIDD